METILLTSATSIVKWAATYHAKELVVQIIIFIATMLVLRNLAMKLINLLTNFVMEVRDTKSIFTTHAAQMVERITTLDQTVGDSIKELKGALVTLEYNHAKNIKRLDDRVKVIENVVLNTKPNKGPIT